MISIKSCVCVFCEKWGSPKLGGSQVLLAGCVCNLLFNLSPKRLPPKAVSAPQPPASQPAFCLDDGPLSARCCFGGVNLFSVHLGAGW